MNDMPTTGTVLPEMKSFDETVLEIMKEHKIPGGALAVLQNGRLIYARGYGYADRDKKTPALPTSLFRLASVSKSITAVAIMTLVQSPQYHLDLETKAFTYLGMKPFMKRRRKVDPRIWSITIRQLLEHSGGWDRDKSGDIMFKHFQIAEEMNIASPPDHEARIRWAMGQKLDFDPGTKYAYSNFGYTVLGRIIEKMTGMTYEKYVQEAVLKPAGIKNMHIGKGKQSERRPDEVIYYDPENRMERSVFSDETNPVSLPYAFASPESMDAHGGWLASAVDLARFAAALDRPGRKPILSADTAAIMYQRPAPPLGLDAGGAPSASYYALGWSVRPVGRAGKANYWHTGSMPGTSTLLVRLSSGRSWLLLFNQRTDANVDAALHKAASLVTEWPKQNLFPEY